MMTFQNPSHTNTGAEHVHLWETCDCHLDTAVQEPRRR